MSSAAHHTFPGMLPQPYAMKATFYRRVARFHERRWGVSAVHLDMCMASEHRARSDAEAATINAASARCGNDFNRQFHDRASRNRLVIYRVGSRLLMTSTILVAHPCLETSQAVYRTACGCWLSSALVRHQTRLGISRLLRSFCQIHPSNHIHVGRDLCSDHVWSRRMSGKPVHDRVRLHRS